MTKDEKEIFNAWFLEFEKKGVSPILIIGTDKNDKIHTLAIESLGPMTPQFLKDIGSTMLEHSTPYRTQTFTPPKE